MNIDIIRLLSSDGFIVVNKELAKKLGMQAAVLIGELCAEHKYWESIGQLEDGYFFSTQKNIENNTTIGVKQQKQIIDKLEEIGIISTMKKGVPAKKFYRINTANLIGYFGETSIAESSKQESPNRRINNNNKIIISKNNNEYHSLQNDSIIYSSNNEDTCIINNNDVKINNNKHNDYNIEFEELWKIYPKERRQGKKKALESYIKVRKAGTTYEEVKSGIERYKRHIEREKTPPQYIKQAQTYFNGACWQDEYGEDDDNKKPRIIGTEY